VTLPPAHQQTTTQILQRGPDAGRHPVRWNGFQQTAQTVIDGKYRLVRPLGRGGMAEVWLAGHVHLKTEVALKFLSASLSGDAEQTRMGLERFQFEAQISSRLGARTRHIVAVHDAGVHEKTPYLVMEYVAGRNLVEEISEHGPMDPLRLADLLDQVADALTVAHEMGIVHRDIKPSNVMLAGAPGDAMMAKVADFGIAKALRSNLDLDRPKDTSSTAMIGSPIYMSPEQIRAPASVSARSDVWSLGVLVYEALTNGSPFNGDTMGEVIISVSTQEFQRPSRLRPSLPRAVDAWFARVLAKDPAQRFASVAEMAQGFRAAVTSSRAPRRQEVVGAVLVASLAAVAVVTWAVLDEPPAATEARLLPPIVRQSVPPRAQPPAPSAPEAAAAAPAAPLGAGAPGKADPVRLQPALPRSPQDPAPATPTATAAPAAPPAGAPSRRKEIDKSEIL
jgi:eukaryotic-like serine/threonine-protein kinase